MIKNISKFKLLSLEAIIVLLILLFYMALPGLLKPNWFSVVSSIREAIHTGDGAKLFLASVTLNLSNALLSFVAYVIALTIVKFFLHKEKTIVNRILIFALYFTIRLLSWLIFDTHIEPVLDLIIMTLLVVLTMYAKMTLKNVNAELIIALQIFIAIQWLNTMPALNSFQIGYTELPISIKLVGEYLNTSISQNIISLAFMIPLLLSATMTSMRFRSNNIMMDILKENVQKAKELKEAQAKIMENRVYKEVNAMAHDLKTPLVTIRGLNSMLMLSKDVNKLVPYTERIEGAVKKMGELISGFLYGSHREILTIKELMQYVRAQVPQDNDQISIHFNINQDDTPICGNKIRLSRAIINIIENAIIATTGQDKRNLVINSTSSNGILLITISDNGKGIEVDQLNHIFEIGYSGVGSTGLGLAFAKQIVEEHQGQINIDSTPGAGTQVKITLPVSQE